MTEKPVLYLPAHVPFPVVMLLFAQRLPPLAMGEAGMRLQSMAKRNDLYRVSVQTDPPSAVKTLGQWLFGIPSIRGHLDVLAYADRIQMQLYIDIPEARTLVLWAAEKLGLHFLQTHSTMENKT